MIVIGGNEVELKQCEYCSGGIVRQHPSDTGYGCPDCEGTGYVGGKAAEKALDEEVNKAKLNYDLERMKVMDNKEKVLVDFAIKCIKGEVFNINSYAKEALEKLQPKVKLPKAAYEWMERIKDLDIDSFDVEIGEIFHRETNREPILRGLYITDKVSISDLYDAYRYGYELEETEEERIKREMKKLLEVDYDCKRYIDDTVNDLYNIATSKDN